MFCGMGGASDGLRAAGHEVLGVEWNEHAAASHSGAGHITIHTDSTSIVQRQHIVDAFVKSPPPVSYRDTKTQLPWDSPGSQADIGIGLWVSPPCTAFSIAGKGEGVKYKNRIKDCIKAEDWSKWPGIDPDIWLPLEVGRWTQMLKPQWVLCEQVIRARELWETYEEKFQEWGYHTWSGVLNCADYGLAQTRKRAFFMASLDRPVAPPAPTHAKDGADDLIPWVSMAQALGWNESGDSWPFTMPATTVCGDPRITSRSHHYPGEQGRSPKTTQEVRAGLYSGKGPIKLTVEEALMFQGFNKNRFIAGKGKGAMYKAIGNACPPLMAELLAKQVSNG